MDKRLNSLDAIEKRLGDLSTTVLAETISAADTHIITAVESRIKLQTKIIINQKLDGPLKEGLDTRINNCITDRLHNSIADNNRVIYTALRNRLHDSIAKDNGVISTAL